MPKPFAIIEKRNDLGDHPDQEETFFPGQCVSQDLGKLPEHKLAHAIDLIGSVTGFAVPPMDKPRISSQLK